MTFTLHGWNWDRTRGRPLRLELILNEYEREVTLELRIVDPEDGSLAFSQTLPLAWANLELLYLRSLGQLLELSASVRGSTLRRLPAGASLCHEVTVSSGLFRLYRKEMRLQKQDYGAMFLRVECGAICALMEVDPAQAKATGRALALAAGPLSDELFQRWANDQDDSSA